MPEPNVITRLTRKAAHALICGWYASEPGCRDMPHALTEGHFPPKEGDTFDLDLHGVRMQVRAGVWCLVWHHDD